MRRFVPHRSLFPLILSLLLVFGYSFTDAHAQFEADARWAPADTNVVVLVNSGRIFDSALAKKANVEANAKAAFETGVSIVTPGVDRLLIASQIDLEAMHSNCTVALFARNAKPIDFNGIVNRVGASVDRISGRDTALMPNDAYVAQLGPLQIGAMKPGNRQLVSKWLKTGSSVASSQLSDYLKSAVSFADKNADIIIAIDLEGSVNPSLIRQRLPQMASVPKEETEAVAVTLEKLKGVTLGVTIRESINGSLKVDFSSDAAKLSGVGKALLIEVLKHKGVMIDDFANWTAKTTERELILSGPLSISGLRAINSLISQPMLPEMTEEASSPALAPYSRTKTYFESLQSYFSDLSTKEPDYKTLRSYAAWFDLYADKIDSLSVVGVDEEAVTVGVSMSENLRHIGSGLRDTQSILNAQQGNLKANAGYTDYYYRYSASSQISQRKALKTGAQSFAEVETREVLRKLADEVAATRRALTMKYNVPF